MEHKPLPRAELVEKATLGLLLQHPDLLPECDRLGIDDGCFHSDALAIWRQIVSDDADGKAFDLITVSQSLLSTHNGDGQRLATLATDCHAHGNFESMLPEYANQLLEVAAEREGRIATERYQRREITREELRESLNRTAETRRDGCSLLDARRFQSNNPPPPSRPIYWLANTVIATQGNLVAVAAQAKAGKSALVGALIAATTGEGDTLGVASGNTDAHAVLHFDTEQSPADHHALISTALRRTGRECPAWLRSYRVADIPMAQRFPLLEYELERAKHLHGGIHSVILDGVADFIADPNDAIESFAIVENLHRLSVKWDTTIICVLHINPGSEYQKTRGHLGSQLERKTLSNLTLEKDDEGITVIYSKNSRHAHLSKQNGPRFQWDNDAGMHLSCDTARQTDTAVDLMALEATADEIFAHGRALRYSEVTSAIVTIRKVKQRQAERIASEIKKAGLMRKNLLNEWEKSK